MPPNRASNWWEFHYDRLEFWLLVILAKTDCLARSFPFTRLSLAINHPVIHLRLKPRLRGKRGAMGFTITETVMAAAAGAVVIVGGGAGSPDR